MYRHHASLCCQYCWRPSHRAQRWARGFAIPRPVDNHSDLQGYPQGQKLFFSASSRSSAFPRAGVMFWNESSSLPAPRYDHDATSRRPRVDLPGIDMERRPRPSVQAPGWQTGYSHVFWFCSL